MFGHLRTIDAVHVGLGLAGVAAVVVTMIGVVLIGRYRHLAANPSLREAPKPAVATDVP